MKRCPTCQRSYTDDSLTFCLEDGAALKYETASNSSSEPPATMILSEPPATTSNRSAAPTEMYNATPTQGASAPGYTTPPPPSPSWTPQPPAPQSQPFGQPSWAATSAATSPPNKFLLAALGGVVMAVPSLIPLVQLGCCLWAAAGGLLAAGLYIKKSPTKVEMSEGAVLGAIAGGIAGLINLGIGLPITYSLYGPEGPFHSKEGDLGGTLVGVGIIGSLMLVAFSIVGGLLAVPLFEKRRNAAIAPPPPPTYGSGTGGYR
ncbi:MAG: hypothetical protein QOF02_127 [Blastocatellia bacterium]|jgi:hypothetical protein|nr:hypothetical protein [Blastocatellia bacterium]